MERQNEVLSVFLLDNPVEKGSRNENNLVKIKIKTSNYDTKASIVTNYFVPSVLLSNTMSLTPKIDEVAFTMKNHHCDIAAITETWLKESIPDTIVNIEDINYSEEIENI